MICPLSDAKPKKTISVADRAEHCPSSYSAEKIAPFGCQPYTHTATVVLVLGLVLGLAYLLLRFIENIFCPNW
jgi:hypothetical protein